MKKTPFILSLLLGTSVVFGADEEGTLVVKTNDVSEIVTTHVAADIEEDTINAVDGNLGEKTLLASLIQNSLITTEPAPKQDPLGYAF